MMIDSPKAPWHFAAFSTHAAENPKHAFTVEIDDSAAERQPWSRLPGYDPHSDYAADGLQLKVLEVEINPSFACVHCPPELARSSMSLPYRLLPAVLAAEVAGATATPPSQGAERAANAPVPAPGHDIASPVRTWMPPFRAGQPRSRIRIIFRLRRWLVRRRRPLALREFQARKISRTALPLAAAFRLRVVLQLASNDLPQGAPRQDPLDG